MKKLMKAIAFATVMCMLLSTAAFAEITPSLDEDATKTLNISINQNGNNEQVSLLILKTSASLGSIGEGDILYIDQTAANDSGVATFTAALDTEETVVAIYSGNATYAASGAATAYQYRGEVSIAEEVTEVVIEVQECGFVVDQSAAEDYTGTGVYATVDFTAVPEGYSISKMIWAIETVDKGFVYTPVVDLAELGYSVLEAESGIKFAAAINNGSVKSGISTETVKSVDAIFLFVKNGEDNLEVFTDNEATHKGNNNANK